MKEGVHPRGVTTVPSSPQEATRDGGVKLELFNCAAFAKRLRVRMAEQNITYREAAAQVGVSAATMHRVARTGRPPDVENYFRLLHWLSGSAVPAKTNIARIIEAIGLLNSMIMSGEHHTDRSQAVLDRALDAVVAISEEAEARS